MRIVQDGGNARALDDFIPRAAMSGSLAATRRARSTSTLACFQVASSCILPSIMTAPVPSGMASTICLANATSAGSGENTRLAIGIWVGCSVQAPAQPIRNALRNCASQASRIGEVAERPVERLDAAGRAGVDHLGDGVVPEILLERGALAAFRPRHRPAPCNPGWPPPTRVVFMAREAARSAGPRLMPCMRGEAVAIAATFSTPSAVSRMAWIRIGFFSWCLASSCASSWSR